MSRIHINFERKGVDQNEPIYEVVTPDFSSSGIEDECIGEVVINFDEHSFYFKPRADLVKEFFPPEYFNEYSFDEADAVAKEKDFYYTAWSYFIYKKAIELLESKQ